MPSNGDDADRLKDLDARIAAARAAQAPPPRKRENKLSQAGLAWRMLFELAVGIAVGFWMGWGLDSLLGTMPVFLILLTLLGFAAGVRVMLQSAKEAGRRMEADAAETARRSGSEGASAPTDKGRQRGG